LRLAVERWTRREGVFQFFKDTVWQFRVIVGLRQAWGLGSGKRRGGEFLVRGGACCKFNGRVFIKKGGPESKIHLVTKGKNIHGGEMKNAEVQYAGCIGSLRIL